MIDSEAAHNLEAKSGDERLYFSYDVGGRTALMYAAVKAYLKLTEQN